MSKHSKAPWIMQRVFQDKIEIHHSEPRVPGAASLVVARVTARESWINEQTANARLIAAAPDLLAELQNIANAEPSHWEYPGDFRAWAQNRARTAIAQAIGVQS